VVFGGRTKAGGQTFALNDTWSLCLHPRLRWVEQKFAADESLAPPRSAARPALPAAALLPLPRRNHAGCRFGKPSHTHTHTHATRLQAGLVRSNACVRVASTGTKLVVIGGWSGRENYGQSLNDVFLLEVSAVTTHTHTRITHRTGAQLCAVGRVTDQLRARGALDICVGHELCHAVVL
jgi:hypothetical protein